MISKFAIDLTSDLAGLAAGVLLVKPAWRAIGLAKQRHQVDQVQLSSSDPKPIRDLQKKTSTQIGEEILTWERSDEWAIRAGIILVIFSFGIKIIWALMMGPEVAHCQPFT